MPRRRVAATLVEVLVAIFVMGVGLICLLSLFPLGAMLMAQSIKDNRSGHAGNTADAIARALRLERHERVFPIFGGDGQAPVPVGSPSYAIFVDPYAIHTGATGMLATRVAGVSPGIPRVCPGYPIPSDVAGDVNIDDVVKTHALCTLLDDMPFLENGLPRTTIPPTIPPTIRREYRYSWGWMFQRARWSPLASATEQVPISLHVLVYNSRPMAGLGETAYTGVFTAGSRSASITWSAGQTPPAIKNGNWILDATMPPNAPQIRCHFYRVIATRLTSATSMDLELQTEAKATSNPATAIFMEGLVEVFEKSTR